MILHKTEQNRLRLEDAQLRGSFRKINSGGHTAIHLGRDGEAVFDAVFRESGYYSFTVTYGNLAEGSLPHVQIMLDNRILATTYNLTGHEPLPCTEELGIHLISRGRHELKLASMCEPAVCPKLLTIEAVERKVEKPLFSFALISDTHLGAAVGGKVNNLWLSDKVPEIMDSVIREIKELSPDFLIHLGDIADDGRKSDDLEAVKKIMDNLGCPYHLVLGNHDTWEDGRSNIKKIFNFPKYGAKSFYSFDYCGFHFVVLDSVFWQYEDGSISDSYHFEYKYPVKEIVIPEGQLSWLEEDLSVNSPKKTFLFTHALMAPAEKRSWDGRRVGPEAGHCFLNWSQTLDITDRFPDIMAVFCGHAHVNQLSIRDGVHHYQVGSLVEYPFIYRFVVVFPSHFEVSCRQISDRRYALESYIRESKNNWIGINSDLSSEMMF